MTMRHDKQAYEGCDPVSGLVWRLRPARTPGNHAGASDSALVVVYSQARVPNGRFGLERLFNTTRHACLFVNAPDETWYVGCDDALDHVIEAARAQTGAQRIIHYGASKGAYGALMMGLRRNDGAIYAFGPELELGQAGSQSRRHMRVDVPPITLADTIGAAATGADITIVFGLLDAVDAAGAIALRTRRLPSRVRTLCLRSTHASHDHLYSQNIIRKLITRFDRDLGTLCAERGLVADDALSDITRFAEAGVRFAQTGPHIDNAFVERIRTDPYCAANPGFGLLRGQILHARGQLEDAAHELANLQMCLDADPVLRGLPKRWRKIVWRERQSIARARNDGAEIERLRADICLRFPEDPTFSSGTDQSSDD